MIDLDALQSAAKAATLGPGDAEFIAAANPAVVLELIARVRALEKTLKRIDNTLNRKAFDVREAALWAENVIFVEDVREAMRGTPKSEIRAAIAALHQVVGEWDDYKEAMVCGFCGETLDENFECSRGVLVIGEDDDS